MFQSQNNNNNPSANDMQYRSAFISELNLFRRELLPIFLEANNNTDIAHPALDDIQNMNDIIAASTQLVEKTIYLKKNMTNQAFNDNIESIESELKGIKQYGLDWNISLNSSRPSRSNYLGLLESLRCLFFAMNDHPSPYGRVDHDALNYAVKF